MTAKRSKTKREISDVRPRGRPRQPKVHAAILKATLRILAERGAEGLTLEAIAERAKVGRPTIYRRWNGKEELVAEAVESTRQPIRFPDTGSVWRDLEGLAAQTIEISRRKLYRRLFAMGISSGRQAEPFFKAYWTDYVLPRRESMRALLHRAQLRGEIRENLDLDHAMDAIVGGWTYLALFKPHHARKADLMRLARFILS